MLAHHVDPVAQAEIVHQARAVEFSVLDGALGRGAAAFFVIDNAAGSPGKSEACVGGAQAEFCILIIEEVVFTEKADVVKNFAFNEHGRAAEIVNLGCNFRNRPPQDGIQRALPANRRGCSAVLVDFEAPGRTAQ